MLGSAPSPVAKGAAIGARRVAELLSEKRECDLGQEFPVINRRELLPRPERAVVSGLLKADSLRVIDPAAHG
jgi:hypothetical protein